ncbi:MAG: LamG domain-containing protein [Planctomycetes bacterium]|nr:LamG domain-containing protein [Planctomycetota bacterium]
MNAIETVKSALIGGVSLAVIAASCSGQSEEKSRDRPPTLIAHWPLNGNTDDAVGPYRGVARNVTFGEGPGGAAQGAALLNGRDSWIEVAAAEPLDLGEDDFSITVWVKPESPIRSVFGSVLSKFDARQRRGVNLQIAGSSPAYNAMSDARHVQFGIDDGYLGPWEDCGKPWATNSHVPCLIVFKGELYCGIADAEDPKDAARVFRWGGGKKWIDCGRLGNDPNHLSVQSMIVHRGKLYAGTGIWDWVRSRAGAEGKPPAARTRVFVYDGGTQWRDLGQVGHGSRVLCMGSFDGELYAGLDSGAGGGRCFKHDGAKWIDCGAPDGGNFESFLPLGGTLYAATHGNVYRYEGNQQWACIGKTPFEISQIHCLGAVEGKLHAGTWPQGYVLRHEGGEDWTITGRLGLPKDSRQRECNEVNDLIVHNGKLYAGVIPKAECYRYEADGQWTLLDSLASRPDWAVANSNSWCRLTCLTSFEGRLFASTGSCRGRAVDVDSEGTLGRIYSLQTGQVVGYGHDIGSGWTHLAAVRQGRQLRLYVNGRLAATSQLAADRIFNLTNSQPLRIGLGAQGHFTGAIADLRWYRGTLDAEGVERICANVPVR